MDFRLFTGNNSGILGFFGGVRFMLAYSDELDRGLCLRIVPKLSIVSICLTFK